MKIRMAIDLYQPNFELIRQEKSDLTQEKIFRSPSMLERARTFSCGLFTVSRRTVEWAKLFLGTIDSAKEKKYALAYTCSLHFSQVELEAVLNDVFISKKEKVASAPSCEH